MPVIQIKTTIKADIKVVFDLSRSIDLHLLSTSQSNEKAIAGKTSGLIGLNETVTWRAKHFGVYQKLTTKITAFSAPNYFVDEMVKGVFKSFKHQHIFETVNGQTIMTDIFEYQSPFGIIGKTVDFVFLKSYMNEFLKKRNNVIKQIAESEDHIELLKTQQLN